MAGGFFCPDLRSVLPLRSFVSCMVKVLPFSIPGDERAMSAIAAIGSPCALSVLISGAVRFCFDFSIAILSYLSSVFLRVLCGNSF